MILDEATNSLDSVSEEMIRSYLARRLGDCTVIVVSHRLSSVFHADQVLVLSEGSLQEQGAPRELIRRRGLLSKIRELQHVG